MKTIFRISLVLVLIVTLFIGGIKLVQASDESGGQEVEIQVCTGEIKKLEKNDKGEVVAILIEDGYDQTDIWVEFEENAVLQSVHGLLENEELEIGMMVEAEVNGPILESMPARGKSSLIGVLIPDAPIAEPNDFNLGTIKAKVLVNISGEVSEISEDGCKIKVGDLWVIINERTLFQDDPDNGIEPVSEKFEIGNMVQGYTEDDINNDEVTATVIYNNYRPTIGNADSSVSINNLSDSCNFYDFSDALKESLGVQVKIMIDEYGVKKGRIKVGDSAGIMLSGLYQEAYQWKVEVKDQEIIKLIAQGSEKNVTGERQGFDFFAVEGLKSGKSEIKIKSINKESKTVEAEYTFFIYVVK